LEIQGIRIPKEIAQKALDSFVREDYHRLKKENLLLKKQIQGHLNLISSFFEKNLHFFSPAELIAQEREKDRIRFLKRNQVQSKSPSKFEQSLRAWEKENGEILERLRREVQGLEDDSAEEI
jgi:hypothetical protein